MMKEEFLYVIWDKQLFNPIELYSINKEPIEILEKGLFNNGDGPDVLEAKVRVDRTILVGSVEFHIKTSDWLKHKHDKDPRYKNVILHVVWLHDIELPSLKCPTLEMNGRIPRYYFDNYLQLKKQSRALPCAFALKDLKKEWLDSYRTELLKERFKEKQKEIVDSYSNIKLDRIYQVFLTVFGTPQNRYGYNILSERIPYRVIRKHKHDKHILEAILFGVSGLLTLSVSDCTYIKRLKGTYIHFKTIYNFNEMSRKDWTFLRVRPYAFPTIRIALLADLFYNISSIENFVLEESHHTITNVLKRLKPSSYWNNHFVFNKTSKPQNKSIGKAMILKLWINAIIPLRLMYIDLEDIKDKNILMFLKEQPSENNKITRIMVSNGFLNKNAYQSQFNLHKYKYYCIPRKCLNCGIGYKIIRKHD